MPKQRRAKKKIFVIDVMGEMFDSCSENTIPISRIFRSEQKLTCSGLAILARKYCANFGLICKNCRLNNHRKKRCGYFERAVLQGMEIKDAEKYVEKFDLASEYIRGRVRVAAEHARLPDPSVVFAPDENISL